MRLLSLKTISPNADGVDDITRINYRLREPASVSIYFVDSNGRRFEFRQKQPRDAGEHTLLFSGIVNASYVANGSGECENCAACPAKWKLQVGDRVGNRQR